ncbi:MAG: D-glucuronyl C5-epimerase family protein [Propionibacteriaceae bacterium]|nr:D-glucuronyl C5-epimerase family protein [Propionibacteriaceae bacterium]
MKRFGTVLAAVLTAALGTVALPPPEAAATPNPYVEPGLHVVNGREWRTECEEYSSTVTRCRAEIKATQVQRVGGKYVEVTDWVFNNLTYLPSAREQWRTNPLAAYGKVGGTLEWPAADGRLWRTECDTATTGRNGCRAYTMSKVIAVKTLTPRTYEQREQWVFNNVVQFTAPQGKPSPASTFCNGTALPPGFALTNEGRPHAVKTPYSPNTLYNPTSITNFINTTVGLYQGQSDKGSQRAKDLKCLAELGAKHLMQGSETTQDANGDVVRWFPYMFQFSANPTMADLTGPWHSGLAQGGALRTFIGLADITGDNSWLQRGAETFRSFTVPISQPGGIVHRNSQKGFLWFEEYPTKPLPTTVLNGHLEAVLSLDVWHRRMIADGDQAVTPPHLVKALVDEALAGLEPMLKLHEVPHDGGLLTSYDLLRGYPAAPLRILGNGVNVSATLNNQPVALPAVADNWQPSTLVPNGTFATLSATDPSLPEGWARFGSATYSQVVSQLVNGALQGDYVRIVSGGNAWQGMQHLTLAEDLAPVAGQQLSMTVRAAVKYPANAPGASGRVAVYSDCAAGRTLQFEHVLRGTGAWNNYTFGFQAPPAGCGLLVQIMIAPYSTAGTEVWFDDLTVSAAQPVGTAHAPKYDLRVYNTPVNTLRLTGSGSGILQAHQDGRWQNISRVSLSGQPHNVVIPERFTGRNIHFGYHEMHVSELLSLFARHPEQKFLRDYAARWAPMAPALHHRAPRAGQTLSARSVSPAGDATSQVLGTSSSYELLLPPIVDQFTGLSYEELAMLDELQKPAS